MNTDKVYLVGFMAAGKTSVSRLLAERLSWRAEDVDELIEARERLSVAGIFARHGEPYFRAAERDILRLLYPLRQTVVATGGGDNMMSAIQSSLAKTGIKFDIKTAPVNSVLSQTPQCTAKQDICKWQLSYFGTAGSWYFSAFPTGDPLFQTKGGSNFGNYSNPAVDKLISRSTTSSSTATAT